MSISPRFTYLLSVPGLLRLFNVILGVLSVILTLIGFTDDFQEADDIGQPYLTYYGLGYKEERANQWNLIALCICLTISAAFLLVLLVATDFEERLKGWNRFLNISLAILLFLGWISGLLGFLQFRQGCCRIEMLSLERVKYKTEGYYQPCLCMVKPHNDPDLAYPVLLYQDAPLEFNFLSAQPHHFDGHVASLVLTFLNVLVYIGAFIRV